MNDNPTADERERMAAIAWNLPINVMTWDELTTRAKTPEGDFAEVRDYHLEMIDALLAAGFGDVTAERAKVDQLERRLRVSQKISLAAIFLADTFESDDPDGELRAMRDEWLAPKLAAERERADRYRKQVESAEEQTRGLYRENRALQARIDAALAIQDGPTWEQITRAMQIALSEDQPATTPEPRAEAARAYDEGRWCGGCAFGVVEDPPCRTQPEPEPPHLDPRLAAATALREAADAVHVERFAADQESFSGPGDWFHAHIRIERILRDRADYEADR